MKEPNPEVTRVLAAVLATAGRPLTRGELVQQTGLPRTTIYEHLCRLEACQQVARFTVRGRGRRGRPWTVWTRARVGEG